MIIFLSLSIHTGVLVRSLAQLYEIIRYVFKPPFRITRTSFLTPSSLNVDEILKMGIDDVYCISVNDAFVMRQVDPVIFHLIIGLVLYLTYLSFFI